MTKIILMQRNFNVVLMHMKNCFDAHEKLMYGCDTMRYVILSHTTNNKSHI